MNPMDLTASDLAARVRAGQVTPLEAAQAARARVAERNPELNAITVLNPGLEAEAAAVAARLAAGDDLPLAGVPVVIKDNIWVAGLPITQGSQLFAEFIAPEDAAAVRLLREAGALILGIATCSEFACKGVTNTPLHGITRNPVDPTLTPGGSSGGPVAAVAAGMAPLALGTDAGGSTRRPPAHTGPVGFKPSQDLVPYGPGFDEPVDGISVICPIARDVDDAALAMRVLSDLPPGTPRSGTIAWSADFGLGQRLDADVATAFAAAIACLEAAGYAMEQAAPDWGGLDGGAIMPLQHAGLARLHGDVWRDTPGLVDPDIAAQIESGLALSAETIAAAEEASKRMGTILNAFLARYDAVVVPTTPCPAWPVDRIAPQEIGGAPCAPRDHAAFTPQANHAGCPAISIPFATDTRGLPLGLQIIAAPGADADLLATATSMAATLATHPGEGGR
ncbi:MAG: amidase [Maritimibacter sp.]|nr:amidase [Maritimibacter sp.]